MTHAEQEYEMLRDEVLNALNGYVWKPLEAQPVELIRVPDGFPARYKFDSERTLSEIKAILDDSAFWSWEAMYQPKGRLCLEGRIPVQMAGTPDHNSKKLVRIFGHKPH